MTQTLVEVVPEYDATPFVRLVTRTIRTSFEERPDLAQMLRGTVVIRSASDAQVVTVEVVDARILVTRGPSAAADVVLIVDLSRRLEVVGAEVDGREDLASAMSQALRPQLPDWQDAAQAFWQSTGGDAGMPSRLVIQSVDDGELELGAGLPRYVVHGSPDKLAGLFSGADSFLDEVFAGNLLVRGTLPQLSVMAGASFKVRFHV